MSEGQQGRRWTVTDAWGNPIYLTDERWEHICEGHSELADLEAMIRETVRRGRRSQDPINPQKFIYRLRAPNLPDDNTHIEAVVLLRFVVRDDGVDVPNNYVTTAYPTEVR